MPRGALLVFEGGDRSGKSTQARKLTQYLLAQNVNAQLRSFPDRRTDIGHLIDRYLKRELELTDEAIHLLFAANRWEMMPELKQLLNDGTTLVVDRYSFSGIAFTAAKGSFCLVLNTNAM
jgi:dTMP kinase